MSSRALASQRTDVAYTPFGQIPLGNNNLIACPSLTGPYANAENSIFVDGNPDRPGRDATHGVENVIEIGNTAHQHALVGKYDLGDMDRRIRELETVYKVRIEELTHLASALIDLDRVKYVDDSPSSRHK